MHSVVINADDYGLTDGVCRAINELFDTGAVSNTTVMVTPDGARPRIQSWGRGRLPGVAGLHLTLTGGVPTSPAVDIPSLVDPATGKFLPRQALDLIDERDVETEWQHQIETFVDIVGVMPTHLDSHQGVHRLPQCYDVYLGLASKFNLPVRGGGSDVYTEKRKSAGVRGPAVLIRDWTGHDSSAEHLIEMLLSASSACGPDDVIEVVSHPAYVDDYLISISSLNNPRDIDRVELQKLHDRELLLNNGFVLVRYPDLQPH